MTINLLTLPLSDIKYLIISLSNKREETISVETLWLNCKDVSKILSNLWNKIFLYLSMITRRTYWLINCVQSTDTANISDNWWILKILYYISRNLNDKRSYRSKHWVKKKDVDICSNYRIKTIFQIRISDTH